MPATGQPEKSAELSDIQKDLVLKAADMLRPGGMLLYSTCTFSPCEDEEVVAYLLRQRPDMELIEMPGYEGFSSGRPEYAGTADTSDSEIALSLNAFNPEELTKMRPNLSTTNGWRRSFSRPVPQKR